jgi:hypothetical protein
MTDEQYGMADRFILAQSWWLASELVRRHPHLLISRVADETVASPLLIVQDEQQGMRIQFDLIAWVQYLAAGELRHLDWSEIFSQPNSHAVIKQIETETGLGVPMFTPPTNGRSIVYRSIARILAIEVDGRFGWNAVTAPISLEDADSADWDLLRQFPTSLGAAQKYIDQIFESGDERVGTMFLQPFWAITRDLETYDSRPRRIRSHEDRAGRSDGALSKQRAQAHPDGQRRLRGVSVLASGPELRRSC